MLSNPAPISESEKYQTVISPRGISFGQSFRELLKHRQLLLSFASRDYKVRYAQTYIGYWWSLFQPIASVAVLFVVFQKVVQVPTGGIPYIPFALSGLVLWNYFNYVVTQSAASQIANQGMIRKIYFPRMALPLSRALVGLIDPLVGYVLLVVILFVQVGNPGLGLLSFPLMLLASAVAALGVGFWTSALSIRYRDLQQVLPFVLQLVFFLTPVAYSGSLLNSMIPEQWHFLIYLNPMAGIIDNFRTLLYATPFDPATLISYGSALLLFVSGALYFQKVEMRIADIV